MPTSGSCARNVTLLAALAAATAVNVSAEAPLAIDAVLDRVAQRIAEYYDRAQRLMCIEKLTVQNVGADFSAIGFGRVTEYELHVESDARDANAASEMQVARQLIRVNGRPPRDRDRKNRDSCTDSNPLSPEPLSFLLPSHRGEYTFVLVGPGKGKDADTLIIDYASPKAPNRGELLEDPNGREDCFSWSLDASVKGRVWVNATTFEVVRFEQRLNGMVELKVPEKIQRKHHLDNFIVIDRYDTAIRYKQVAFTDPDETMLLPESIDTISMPRGGLQPTRRRQAFSNYKRFLTGGRIVK